jgi:hypothetical protein
MMIVVARVVRVAEAVRAARVEAVRQVEIRVDRRVDARVEIKVDPRVEAAVRVEETRAEARVVVEAARSSHYFLHSTDSTSLVLAAVVRATF